MGAAVRVLPALIAVSVGVLAFKGVDIYEAVAQVVESAEVATAETELTAGVGDRGNPDATGIATAATASPAESAVAPRADVCLPSLDYAAETGISEQEILVLRSLADRRKALDERETVIETRE